ncbi:hypothetical protein G5714_015611 [Onychostoma macrolepis]|uniref:Uncharacterized protein n=1 Tax=Onychostoma macrolepis TaxID=369639 RepID=A0A7J6C623_9TELE|nr:hypothetical protein G5714_015611 [Onychostoma macrolepis]
MVSEELRSSSPPALDDFKAASESGHDGQATRSKQDYKVTLAALAVLNVKPQYCRICFASPKNLRWWIRSNGSTSIPEILKEISRLLEKLGMMLKGRVLSKSCPLCFSNQYTRTEDRSSDPQPQNPGSHSFDVQPVGTNMVMHSCTFCALVTRQRHPTPSPLFRGMPLKRTCCLRLFIFFKSFFCA